MRGPIASSSEVEVIEDDREVRMADEEVGARGHQLEVLLGDPVGGPELPLAQHILHVPLIRDYLQNIKSSK